MGLGLGRASHLFRESALVGWGREKLKTGQGDQSQPSAATGQSPRMSIKKVLLQGMGEGSY
jgi:hypothetical protein